jgi:hypothetical protein
MYRWHSPDQGCMRGDDGSGNNSDFLGKGIRVWEFKDWDKYGKWKNEEDRVFYLYNNKNAAHTAY